MSPSELHVALEHLRVLLERRWKTSFLPPWAHSFEYLAGPIPFNCYAQINPDMNGFLFRAQLSLPVPPTSRPVMLELSNLINYELPMGSWALDMNTGDLRWKFGVYFDEAGLTEVHMRKVVDPSIFFLDHYVLSVISAFNGNALELAAARIGEDPGIGTSEFCHYKDEPHPRNAA